jgi:hypothetical protein
MTLFAEEMLPVLRAEAAKLDAERKAREGTPAISAAAS